MNTTWKIVALSACLVATACSSREEKLCKSSTIETLLNPETAKFSNFRKLDDAEVASDELMSGLKEILETSVPPDGASYYVAKLQAQGELGNTITKTQFCGITGKRDHCSCVSSS